MPTDKETYPFPNRTPYLCPRCGSDGLFGLDELERDVNFSCSHCNLYLERKRSKINPFFFEDEMTDDTPKTPLRSVSEGSKSKKR